MIGGAIQQTVQNAVTTGSPDVLHMVGRAFGLGPNEQQTLVQKGLPTWFWVTASLMVGFVAGVQVYKRWPDKVPMFVKRTRTVV